jgi:hypothetical protein
MSSSLTWGGGNMHTQISYFPFAYSTDAPITRNSIDSEALIFIRIDTNFIVDRIDSIISSKGSAPIDEKNIRLKLLLKGHTYLFDRLGNGTIDGHTSVHIDPKKFETLVSDKKIDLKLSQ